MIVIIAHYVFYYVNNFRWADNTKAVGIDDGIPRKFDHPFLQVSQFIIRPTHGMYNIQCIFILRYCRVKLHLVGYRFSHRWWHGTRDPFTN